jgi:hypothetical protein
LKFHADGIISHPSARFKPISQNKTFEEPPSDQIKMPHVKPGRKRICGEAEVISLELSERMKKI